MRLSEVLFNISSSADADVDFKMYDLRFIDSVLHNLTICRLFQVSLSAGLEQLHSIF